VVHAGGAERVALAAAAFGARLIHVSAIGADPDSTSAYARTKAQGEEAAFAAVPEGVIFRPSVLFGPEDDFLIVSRPWRAFCRRCRWWAVG
jgi:NADH dehydrogenase